MPSIKESKCVLVIGATAGIGRALALGLKDLPSEPTVIAGGRRQERLEELAKKGPETVQVNVNSGAQTLKKFVDDVTQKYPKLDAVVFAAGIQHRINFAEPEKVDLSLLTDEFNTNYIAVTTLIAYFLPHFIKLGSQGQPCFLIPISSILAAKPGFWVPDYCATKAALHSLNLSLYVQLKPKNVHVMEILPPLVESELHNHQGMSEHLSKFWMPLDEFTKDTIRGLERGDTQILVGDGPGQKDYHRYEDGKLEQAIAEAQK